MSHADAVHRSGPQDCWRIRQMHQLLVQGLAWGEEAIMRKTLRIVCIFLLTLVGVLTTTTGILAQEIPTNYQEVLKVVGKSGDYKANVLKVNVPRNDLHVSIAGYAVPTAFGFGGWFAMTKGDGGEEVLMGDLVLLQDEVNPVMSSLLER